MGKQIFNPLLPKRFQEVSSGSGLVPFVQEQTVSSAGKTVITGGKVLTDDTAVSFVTRITAVKISTGDTWCAILKGGAKRVSGVASIIDTGTLEVFANDAAAVDWYVVYAVTLNEIQFSVNSLGDASAIKWRLETIFNEVLI